MINYPFLCVFIAFLLNYLSKVPLAVAMYQSPGGYNNRHPRKQQAELTGWGRRALAAHLNSFEVFPAFAAAVIIAHLSAVNESYLTVLCLLFLASRILYVYFYLADMHAFRSTTWFFGIFCIGSIFILALM